MTDNELKHLNRSELLEMLIAATQENENLVNELNEARTHKDDRMLKYEKAGSLAEAAVLINGVMEAAQAAADQYLLNIKDSNEKAEAAKKSAEQQATMLLEAAQKRAFEIEETAQKNARRTESEAQEAAELLTRNTKEKNERFIRETQETAAEMIRSTEERSAKIMQDAKEKAEEYWKESEAKLQKFVDAHQELQSMFGKGTH